MANKNILIKRNNGGVIDVLYPQTIITNLFDTDGTTTLFNNGKLRDAYLPSYVFGGLKFVGTFAISGSPSGPMELGGLITGTPSSGYSVSVNLDTFTGLSFSGGGYDGQVGDRYVGHYWVASQNIGFMDTTSGTGASVVWNTAVFDDGVAPALLGGLYPDALSVEAGDWIVITGWDDTNNVFKMSVISNTYADATGTVKGVVTLSTATATTSMNGSTKVITEDVLFDTIGTAAGKIAAGDHLHSGVYQPVDGDLTALAALSGTGFVKRTGADTYTLDTNTYLTTQSQDFGTVTVTDTDSGHTWGTTGSAVADANADTLTIVDGDGVDIDASPTTDAIRISHTDTSTLSGAQGSAGIASITVDGFGHVTAVTTATYNNYSLPLAANGTRGGLQIGFTSTETDRALLLSSERGYITLPRQIPAVTLNGASSTSPSFYAPTGAGLTGSTSQVKQTLIAQTGAAPVWLDAPVIYYDTTTGTTHGDIIFDEI